MINVLYYGSDDVGASGMRGYASAKGVAPVIDLGPYGMLAAALDMNVKEYVTRRDEYGLIPMVLSYDRLSNERTIASATARPR